jgi:hypothetical protein
MRRCVAGSIHGMTPQWRSESHQPQELPQPRGPDRHWWFWVLLQVIAALVLIYGGPASARRLG